MYYWFAILDNIGCTLAILAIVGTIMSVILFFCIVTTEDDFDKTDHNNLVKIGKWLYPTWIISILLVTFLPSQKQMAFIIAAPYIIENQELKDAGQNTAEIIKLGTEYLKEALKGKTNEQNRFGFRNACQRSYY